MSEDDFKSMFENSWAQGPKAVTLERGQKVNAEVLSVGKENVFVLILDGSRQPTDQEGWAPRLEFSELPKVKDKINLFYIRHRDGMLELSAKKSAQAMGEDLQDAFDMESPVQGLVTEVVNGGFRVQVLGKAAFCPFSQIDLRPGSDNATHLNRKYDFVITQLSPRNIVLSRRRVLEQEQALAEGEFLEKCKVGDLAKGRVTRIEKFGAFVELAPGVEGMVHISELGWSRVASPEELVKVGDPVNVKILSLGEDDRGRLRISLSRKQAESDPWVAASAELAEGQIMRAKVLSQERFGILLELKPGVVGLLPKSALRLSGEERDLSGKKPGDTMGVVIDRINTAERRVSLKLADDPEAGEWQKYNSTQPGQTSGFGSLADKFNAINIGSKRK